MKRLTIMDLDGFKEAAKVFARALGFQHTRSLEMLAKVHGYTSYHEVLLDIESPKKKTIALQTDRATWEEQLRQVFGEAAIGSLTPSQPSKLFKRICTPLDESPEGRDIHAFEQALLKWNLQRHSPPSTKSVPVTYLKKRRAVAHGTAQAAQTQTLVAEPAMHRSPPVAAKVIAECPNLKKLEQEKLTLEQKLADIARQLDELDRLRMRQDVIDEANALIAKYSISMAEL